MTKEALISNFDPNGPANNNSLFGLPFDEHTAELVIIPVPWEVTVSYRAGTANGPRAILEASTQVDLFTKNIPDAWQLGITMLPINELLETENTKYRDLAAQHIQTLESAESEHIHASTQIIPKTIDDACQKLNIYVQSEARKYMQAGKMVALLGGDHSTPLGMLKAMAQQHEDFGILQIDAHADLRKAYEGFTFSHASIMYNALKIKNISKLVQVGIRDLCEEEADYIKKANGRVVTFYDEDIKQSLFEGNSWKRVCKDIIAQLPKQVYISFDIDGLDPKLCPNTGTPVPGGLDYEQVVYLFQQVVQSGREIIAFDLNEVAPGEDEWDANVGARLLYQLSNLMAVSQGKLQMK